MDYLKQRARSVGAHAASPRGGLLLVAVVALVGAALTQAPWRFVLAAVASAAVLVLLFVLSMRQADDHELLRSTRRMQERMRGRIARLAEGSRREDPPQGDPMVLRTTRVARAREAILASRVASAVEEVDHVEQPRSRPRSPLSGEADALVTVVVPCHNDARFLPAALESVRQQSFGDWECVVVDDASTDETTAVSRRFVRSDSRFRLIRHAVNGGLAAARNSGLRVARGTLVTFLDADDLLLRDSLLDRVEALAGTGTNVAGSHCGVRRAPEDVALDTLPPHETFEYPRFIDFVSARAECPFNSHAPLLHTHLVRSVGGFDESMCDGGEDWDLWLRLMRRGYAFVPSRWQTAIYRQKRDSMAKGGAVSHVAVARGLIRRSYEADQTLTPATEGIHAYPLPLPVYQQQLAEARRSLQYAATALVMGDVEAATTLLSTSEPGIQPWMDRHLVSDQAANLGFCRAFGLSLDELAELESELAPIRARLARLVGQSRNSNSAIATAHRAEEASDDRQAPVVDTLFAPQTGHQAATMLEVAIALASEHHRCAFILVDRVAGGQGAEEAIRGAPVPTFSVNEWALRGHRHRALVVGFPRDGAIDEIAAATKNRGGAVVEMTTGGESIMRSGGLAPRADTPRVPASELAAYLDAIVDSGMSVRLAEPMVRGPLLWPGTTDPDPDNAYTIEEYPDTPFDGRDIARFHGIHSGERCVIIGNGPSLNDLDLTRLKDEHTFAVNGIFYAAERMGFDPTYYLVEDTMVMNDNLDAIRKFRAGHKFFPSIFRGLVGEANDISYFMMNRGFYEITSPAHCVPRFSTDAAQRLYCGQSVTIINLQLAYYMGFSEVVLIGMDFSYTVPVDAEVDGIRIRSAGDDPNHFHPDYFGRGKVWKDPKLDRVLANYQLAKLMYETDGRRIVNATLGGKLELFDRVPYTDLFE